MLSFCKNLRRLGSVQAAAARRVGFGLTPSRTRTALNLSTPAGLSRQLGSWSRCVSAPTAAATRCSALVTNRRARFSGARCTTNACFRSVSLPSVVPSIRPSLLGGSSLVSRQLSTRATTKEEEKKPYFKKILIANRGEIACRVIRSCRELGIKSVAIYSTADRLAKHVKMADEAVCVGGPLSSDSYLNVERIIKAIKDTGAEAVHPGYGFLSENGHFVGELEKNGIVFIGPEYDAIHKMGLKIESKKIALEAKVNTVPGFVGEVKNEEEAVKIAKEIGYPVMIKASAGGGGKGMRVAWNDKDTKAGFRFSREEAKKSFSDDTIFLEKFIEEPRHIEIQILMDKHGNGVYLNERECSIQRRNQKVVEEAPSTFVDPDTRAKMGEQALALARAVKYVSAGTVEFLVDKHKQFYFLEMNTRLQVEHPITEETTGVDIVAQMIRIAAGEPLTLRQSDIAIDGWAIESRVYAEDPHRNFLPAIGTLSQYIEPRGNSVRCDSGILDGQEISMYYDPMICKLVTHGATRDEALARMRNALDSYVISGVTHNISFLRAVIDKPRFVSGDTTTKFIEEEWPEGFKGIELTEADEESLALCSVAIQAINLSRQGSISGQLDSYDSMSAMENALSLLRVTVQNGTSYVASVQEMETWQPDYETYNESELSDTVTELLEDGVVSNFEGDQLVVFIGRDTDKPSPRSAVVRTNYKPGDALCHVFVDDTHYVLQVLNSVGSVHTVLYRGSQFSVAVHTSEEAQLATYMPEKTQLDTSKMLVSPMPGAVVSVAVKEGDQVEAGTELCVVEAMKMQNSLRAEASGVVKKIHVEPGAVVSTDQLLVEFE